MIAPRIPVDSTAFGASATLFASPSDKEARAPVGRNRASNRTSLPSSSSSTK